MNDKNYSAYKTSIPTDPSFYGSTCSVSDAERIAQNLRGMIESEFPGITVESFSESAGNSKTTGPDDETCDEIHRWIEENWTAAL